MTSTLLTTLVTAAASTITGVITWYTSKRKRDVELSAKVVEIERLKSENSQRIMDQYQEALDDLKKRYDERFEYLKNEYRIRHEDIKRDYERKFQRLKEDKHGEIANLKREIEQLRKSLERWKRKYNELKNEPKQ